ncbi:hypothetical protein HDU96_009659 [Phlyctochytrium bullatum]|nr:hypothetical protein HDU96_009659 [Phlyctochytrium bullatum]
MTEGPVVKAGASVKAESCGFHFPAMARDQQRGPSVLSDQFDVCPAIEERPETVASVPHDSEVNGSFPGTTGAAVERVGVGAGVKENPNCCNSALPHCHVKGAIPKSVRGLHVGPMLDKGTQHVRILTCTERKVQERVGPSRVLCVNGIDRSPEFEKQLNGSEIPRGDGDVQERSVTWLPRAKYSMVAWDPLQALGEPRFGGFEEKRAHGYGSRIIAKRPREEAVEVFQKSGGPEAGRNDKGCL